MDSVSPLAIGIAPRTNEQSGHSTFANGKRRFFTTEHAAADELAHHDAGISAYGSDRDRYE